MGLPSFSRTSEATARPAWDARLLTTPPSGSSASCNGSSCASRLRQLFVEHVRGRCALAKLALDLRLEHRRPLRRIADRVVEVPPLDHEDFHHDLRPQRHDIDRFAVALLNALDVLPEPRERLQHDGLSGRDSL